MQKRLKYTLLFLFFAFAELASGKDILFPSSPEPEDTLFVNRELKEIRVFPRSGRKLSAREYARLIKKIKKVYPYAKLAAAEIDKYNEKFQTIHSEKEKKKYIKKVEKELFKKYEKDFKKMTVSEGRYLMLLIDRETGATSYELIKELKGSLPALFWQGIAKIFGNSLKDEYDPLYKHFVIERIVQMINQGDL